MPRRSLKTALILCVVLLISVLAAHADPRFASLKLTSEPDSAVVILGGKGLGKTPLAAQAIVPGTYLLVVIKNGYRRWTKEIIFEGGKRAVGKATLKAMTQAEADSSRKLDSLQSEAYRNYMYSFYNAGSPAFDQEVAEMALSRLPVLQKRVPSVFIPADVPVTARCLVIVPMLVAENGIVIWARTMKKSGSLVLDDAVWEAARHCRFSPALGPDGWPVRTCVTGFFSKAARRDSLVLTSLVVIDTTGKATAQDQTAAFDTSIAASSGQAGMPFTRLFTKVVKEPVAIKKVEPAYPDEARAFGIEGKVSVMMEIDTSGHVTHAEVMKSSYNDALNQAAVDAAKQWTFKPGLAPGKKPARAWVTQEFTFKPK